MKSGQQIESSARQSVSVRLLMIQRGESGGNFHLTYSKMYDISCIQNVLHIRHIIYTIKCTSHIARGGEEMAV